MVLGHCKFSYLGWLTWKKCSCGFILFIFTILSQNMYAWKFNCCHSSEPTVVSSVIYLTCDLLLCLFWSRGCWKRILKYWLWLLRCWAWILCLVNAMLDNSTLDLDQGLADTALRRNGLQLYEQLEDPEYNDPPFPWGKLYAYWTTSLLFLSLFFIFFQFYLYQTNLQLVYHLQ